ncbi:putative alpha/Beta hydrolase [Lupinus albus]|uniref:Putative alpha/Beta hydrolase n=1 Tax=Lupinus albus TaxID=3870 RepID=A0A6A4PPY0_LUPAL|nr:putative alpha/Beta hydrolase [Lupinus albus]
MDNNTPKFVFVKLQNYPFILTPTYQCNSSITITKTRQSLGASPTKLRHTLTSLYSGYLRRCFRTAGLSSQSIAVDEETTLHFWGPTPKSTNQTTQNKKPSLVLIHGFGAMAIWQWREQVHFFSPHFNAVCVGKLMEKLEVKKFDVVGTSYGGFVAYNLAMVLGEERVEKVVIACSGVNMKKSDNVSLLERAEMDKVEDLLLPSTPQCFRKLMTLCVFSMPFHIPDFFLNDFLKVSHPLFLSDFITIIHITLTLLI